MLCIKNFAKNISNTEKFSNFVLGNSQNPKDIYFFEPITYENTASYIAFGISADRVQCLFTSGVRREAYEGWS